MVAKLSISFMLPSINWFLFLSILSFLDPVHPLLKELEAAANLSTLWINDRCNYQRFECRNFVLLHYRPILFLHQPPSVAYVGGGFFCMEKSITDFNCNRILCDSFYFSIYIQAASDWLKKDIFYAATPVIVWTANRDRPVKENATLHLSGDGDLILRDSDGTVVWSTNTSGLNVAGMRLTDTGSLLLFDHNNRSIWDSIDYPTDVWLVGQTLREGRLLTSNVSPTILSRGQFHLSVSDTGIVAYVDYNDSPRQVYYRLVLTLKSLNTSTYMTFNNGRLDMFSTSLLRSYRVSPPSPGMHFMRLESDGHLKHYWWTITEWSSLEVLHLDACAYPLVCGVYGICSHGQCSCPNSTYFQQIDVRLPNFGCTPLAPLSCQSTQSHHLISFDNVSYFGGSEADTAVLKSVNEELCKQACLMNCSCKAAFFIHNGDTMNGSCYFSSQVLSMMRHDPYTVSYSSSAHIKVQFPVPPSFHKKTGDVALIMGITLAASLVVLLILIVIFKRRQRASQSEEEDQFNLVLGFPKRYSFEELRVATQNFSQKLGGGGFGCVFKGVLSDGVEVAVKQMKRLEGIDQGEKEFLAEVLTIGSIHHINLVSLIGFCTEKSHRLLVYEYMCNGSLDVWIFGRNQDNALAWRVRCKILTDIAKGLSYLHEECQRKIAHFDIKPQNVLLDKDFNAKVSDFGLSKLIDRDESHVMTGMRGTPGYLAPEWLTSKVTEKADVYSFGVVIMEILCRRKNLDFSQPDKDVHLISILQKKAKANRLLDIVDDHTSDMQLHEKEIVEMIKLAMWCLQNDSTKRPSMSKVLKVLEGSAITESDLDYNFTTSTALVPQNVDDPEMLAASILSEPSEPLLGAQINSGGATQRSLKTFEISRKESPLSFSSLLN